MFDRLSEGPRVGSYRVLNRLLAAVALGLALVGLCILLAIPGGGHGWYAPFMFFFPWALLLGPLIPALVPEGFDLVRVLATVFLLVGQFPAYVFALSHWRPQKPRLALVALLGLHFAGVATAFAFSRL